MESLQDVYDYFEKERRYFLSREEAVCYIATTLLDDHKTWASALVHKLRKSNSPYRISDAILSEAMQFLYGQGMIVRHTVARADRGKGRGRPRQMFKLAPKHRKKALELSKLWKEYLERYGKAI